MKCLNEFLIPIILNFLTLSVSIPILPDSWIALDCANATGSINCEWKCHDACIEGYGRDITGTTLKECLGDIEDRTCVIPGVAMTSVELGACCLRKPTPSADESSFGRNDLAELACLVPNITDELKLKFLKRRITSASLDIVSDQLAGKCNGVVEYHTGAKVGEEFRSDCLYDADFSLNKSYVTFGFSQLNIDFTAVAQKSESLGQLIGEFPQILHLLTASQCYGEPTETTLYVEEQFIVNTTDYKRKSSKGMISWTAMLVTSSILAPILIPFPV